ncbi:hypothetical protein RHGRI_001665 [Rhododendron griersonianum]|uniref:Uncharacterized protein n=1 Tax=Rhododendron griersonianum TaxID=479676 RepID=A0AAV6LPY6_9ERIC|nr:hypothetical protein RHGRI_001665 [Rhododendron griersonianum]
MVRKKDSNTGKGIASSSRQEVEEEIVEVSENDSMSEDSDEDSAPLESRTGKREKRRKRRTPEEMEADTKLDWVSRYRTEVSKVNGKSAGGALAMIAISSFNLKIKVCSS